ncbi:MAG: AA10 / CBM2, partial [uncultured Corynebacteriales bacterium]
ETAQSPRTRPRRRGVRDRRVGAHRVTGRRARRHDAARQPHVPVLAGRPEPAGQHRVAQPRLRGRRGPERRQLPLQLVLGAALGRRRPDPRLHPRRQAVQRRQPGLRRVRPAPQRLAADPPDLGRQHPVPLQQLGGAPGLVLHVRHQGHLEPDPRADLGRPGARAVPVGGPAAAGRLARQQRRALLLVRAAAHGQVRQAHHLLGVEPLGQHGDLLRLLGRRLRRRQRRGDRGRQRRRLPDAEPDPAHPEPDHPGTHHAGADHPGPDHPGPGPVLHRHRAGGEHLDRRLPGDGDRTEHRDHDGQPVGRRLAHGVGHRPRGLERHGHPERAHGDRSGPELGPLAGSGRLGDDRVQRHRVVDTATDGGLAQRVRLRV